MKSLIKIILGILFIVLLFNCENDTVDFVAFGTIKGKVVEKGTFIPLENVKVSLSPSNNTTFTDEEGNFIIEEVTVGEYSVEATKQEYLTNFQPANITADAMVNLVFEMEEETASNKPPSIPELNYPLDKQEDIGVEVTLRFNAIDPENDELTYSLKLRNDANNDVLEIDTIRDTIYKVDNLLYGTKYFWQIGVNDGVNTTVLSETKSFSTTEITENRYYFVREINGNNVIYSANYDDDTETVINKIALTDIATNSWRPRRNKRHNLIAFLRIYNNLPHLFTMKPDGSEIKRITDAVPVAGFNLNEIDFSWSPDGDELMYGHYGQLYTINKDGTDLTKIYETTDGNHISECDWGENKIALKTNNLNGYNVKIYTIDNGGNELDIVLENISGAAGGLNLSADENKLLYVRDVTGFEAVNYRQLDSKVFIYDFTTATTVNLSLDKVPGTNDLDPRFAPNEASVIVLNTSNDGVSQKNIYKLNIGSVVGDTYERLFENAYMPDWE